MNVVLKLILIGLLIIIFSCLTVSCNRAKTFKGRVIDADTKEPIEGAVVVAEWMTERDTPTATHTDLKDVKECLTDKNGEWSIRGPEGRDDWPIPYMSLFIPYTKGPAFIVFKPGYCSWPAGFYIDACKEKIRPGGSGKIRGGETVELPRLIKREDRWKAEGVGPDFMTEILADKQKAKKIKNLLRLLNEERKFLGLSEYPISKELENEK